MYIFTFTLLALSAFKEIFLKKGRYHVIIAPLVVLWLVFHDGLRWGVGTDWNAYYDYFSNCLVAVDPGFESGYIVINKIVRSITDNYSVFLVLHASIVYFLIAKSILKYSVSPLFSFFFFYCLMLTYLGMNRQYISFAICLYSYQYIFDKRFFPFLFCLGVAFLFHKSSIMFLPAYFLNREIKQQYLVVSFLLIAIISIIGVMNHLPLRLFFLFSSEMGEKLDFYSGSSFLQTNLMISVLALLKRSMWVILAISFRKGIKNRDANYDFFFNMYFLGTLMYMLFNNTVLQIVVSRGILYFNIAEIFLIPYLLTIFKTGVSRIAAFVLVSCYGFLLIEKGINFYKDDLGIDIFRPYNSVLIDDTYDAMKK